VQANNSKQIDRRKTTVTGVSRRYPALDPDSLEQTRSAPASPALHHVRQKTIYNQTSIDPIENVRLRIE
jgi:hypothetical protein